jgi:hypothetical protein
MIYRVRLELYANRFGSYKREEKLLLGVRVQYNCYKTEYLFFCPPM